MCRAREQTVKVALQIEIELHEFKYSFIIHHWFSSQFHHTVDSIVCLMGGAILYIYYIYAMDRMELARFPQQGDNILSIVTPRKFAAPRECYRPQVANEFLTCAMRTDSGWLNLVCTELLRR